MFSTLANITEYTGGVQYSTLGDIMSTARGVQYTGGYHEECGGYHEYTGGCSVHWVSHTNSIVFPMTYPTFIMISSLCTHDIPSVLMISPRCSEHSPLYCTPPVYCTDIMQGANSCLTQVGPLLNSIGTKWFQRVSYLPAMEA